VKWETTPETEIFFAFCYPWSLKDHDNLMTRVEEGLAERKRNHVYLHRETLTHSIEGRPVEIITLTANVSANNNIIMLPRIFGPRGSLHSKEARLRLDASG
jgi:hypothetical protein